MESFPAQPETPFRRNAVRPMECLGRAFDLVRKEYWLFLGITLVGVILASYGPLGILMGPMLCGLYRCFLRRLSGEPIGFGDLFRGFDYFLQSLLATIPILLASFVLSLLMVAAVFAGVLAVVFGSAGAARLDSDAVPVAAVLGSVAVGVGFMVLLIFVLLLFAVLTTFTYPLIVDLRLSGFDALALAARSGLANARGLAGLFLLNMALGLAGACLCYVGAFLVLPITFAAQAEAYRQVFPEGSGEGTPPGRGPEEVPIP